MMNINDLKRICPNIKFAEEHHRIYDDFVPDLMHRDDLSVYHPNEYNRQPVIKLVCSQHPIITEFRVFSDDELKEIDRLQRRYTDEWIRFLNTEKLPVKEVDVCSAVNQKVFDALCNQDRLESLRIKWLKCKQIDEISKLKNLKKLFLERASSLTDISPLSHLENLEVLILCETTKITDYSSLADLKKLKVLGICCARTSYNTAIKVKDIDFIKNMPSLEYVDLSDIKLI
ncbi:MAG: hypothetical protein IKH51_06135 [Clostridia bacterium]|nr:hypothetical protein [Clostridia bacterium]